MEAREQAQLVQLTIQPKNHQDIGPVSLGLGRALYPLAASTLPGMHCDVVQAEHTQNMSKCIQNMHYLRNCRNSVVGQRSPTKPPSFPPSLQQHSSTDSQSNALRLLSVVKLSDAGIVQRSLSLHLNENMPLLQTAGALLCSVCTTKVCQLSAICT